LLGSLLFIYLLILVALPLLDYNGMPTVFGGLEKEIGRKERRKGKDYLVNKAGIRMEFRIK
jgi:hypothetical protein